MEYIEGKKIIDSPNSVSLRGTEIILDQMKNMICKIYIKDYFKGTGFFCKIPYNGNLLPIFMTNNHIINEDRNKFNELGLIRDSDYANQKIYSDKGKPNNNKTSLNYSLNIHNKISDNLANDSQEEIDENNDAEPEDLVGRNQDKLNNTLDDI